MRPARLARVFQVLLGCCTTINSAAAQSADLAPVVPVSSPKLGASSSSFSPGDDDDVKLPPISISGAPRSYQIVTVPVPEALAQSNSVEVVIIPHGNFVVLGALKRTLNVAQGEKQVGIALGIPANSRAGRTVAAELHFISVASPTLIVPLEIDVAVMRSIAIQTAVAPVRAQAGGDFFLPFGITNSGNGIERLIMDLTLPEGWARPEVSTGAVTIESGETIQQKVHLRVPPLSSTGASFVRVALVLGHDTVAAKMMAIEVFNSGSISPRSGPIITAAYTHAMAENSDASGLATFTANGPLYDSVNIDAYAAIGPAPGAAATYAFSNLGTYYSTAYLTLSAPSAQLTLGNTGTSLTDLTGLYLYGQGGLFYLGHPRWNILALGARSLSTNFSIKREPLLGFRAEHQVGFAHVSGSISHLATPAPYSRQLDAIGAGAAVPVMLGSTLIAEIAERRFQGGSGLGWSGQLTRMVRGDNAELKVSHAPGGSDAFARAVDVVEANIFHHLFSRAAVGASAWQTTDETSVFSALRSKGVSLRPQYTLFGGTTIALEGRTYSYEATSLPTTAGNTGSFGNREQQVNLSLTSYVRRYYLVSTAYLGNLTRSSTPIAGVSISQRVPRNYWITNAGWSGAGGFLEGQLRLEQTRDRGGFVVQQNLFGIRGEQVVVPWLSGIRALGELQRVIGFGDQRSSLVRAGLAVPLFPGFVLRLDVERNSIFRTLNGAAPWIFGVRYEQTTRARMLRAPGTSGYVYRDLNANQRRDAGEPGVAGAIVRRGGVTAVTNQSGSFRVSGDASRPIQIDETSLPDGWATNSVSQSDLGVTLSSSAQIELVVAPRSGVVSVQVDLSKAHVIARDGSGREWHALMSGPTTATFPSLPAGTYTLELDLSELSEPLVVRSPPPLLTISGTDQRTVSITLDPRPIRIWDGSGGPGPPEKNRAPSTEQHPELPNGSAR